MAPRGIRHDPGDAKKLDVDGLRWGLVATLPDWKWSPRQIAATLKRAFPNQAERHVSHETIYTAIYAQPRGELRRQLIACPRQGRGTRLPRTRGVDRRGQIPGMASIHGRPPEVEDRVMPGHWQGDFIKGAGNKSSFDFPYAHARPTGCRIEFGDTTTVGTFPSATFDFEPVNQYTLQIERFSRRLLGEPVPSWPIEDALGTLQTIEALFESARSGGWQALPV